MNTKQVSARELLGALAYCATVAWCFSFTSASNVLVWISLVASAFLSFLFSCVAATETGSKLAYLTGLPVFACCFLPEQFAPFISPMLLLNALLLFFLGIFAASHRQPMRWRTLVWLAVGCNGLSIAVVVCSGMSALRSLNAMRARYPIASLESRLAYEMRPSGEESASESAGKLATDLDALLEEREHQIGEFSMRRVHLKNLHAERYEKFIRAIGFGVIRMMRPRDEEIQLPPLKNIAFDSLNTDDLNFRKYGQLDVDLHDLPDTKRELHWIHEHGLFSFANPSTLGYTVEKRVRIAGFADHGFRYSPIVAAEETKWRIKRLELVSLLKFASPRVYVLDHLPRMDQLKSLDAPTRALDTFETSALRSLHFAQELIVKEEGHTIRMVGAVRAQKQCLNCHNVRRGELLGAFSYVLQSASVK